MLFLLSTFKKIRNGQTFSEAVLLKKNQPKYTKNKQQAHPSLILKELHVEVGRLLYHDEDFNSFSSI